METQSNSALNQVITSIMVRRWVNELRERCLWLLSMNNPMHSLAISNTSKAWLYSMLLQKKWLLVWSDGRFLSSFRQNSVNLNTRWPDANRCFPTDSWTETRQTILGLYQSEESPPCVFQRVYSWTLYFRMFGKASFSGVRLYSRVLAGTLSNIKLSQVRMKVDARKKRTLKVKKCVDSIFFPNECNLFQMSFCVNPFIKKQFNAEACQCLPACEESLIRQIYPILCWSCCWKFSCQSNLLQSNVPEASLVQYGKYNYGHTGGRKRKNSWIAMVAFLADTREIVNKEVADYDLNQLLRLCWFSIEGDNNG